MKKHTKNLPREGYLACAVREFYPDLRRLKTRGFKIRKALL